MKYQCISLFLVASVALTRQAVAAPLRTVESLDQLPSHFAEQQTPELVQDQSAIQRRTLIGDETTVKNQVDNSRGKHTVHIDHVGDDNRSTVHRGVLSDFAIGEQRYPRAGMDDFGSPFERRGLLDGLFGSDSTSIENINDNSQNKKTWNEHGNKHTTVKKTYIKKESGDRSRSGTPSMEEFFDRRSMDAESMDKIHLEEEDATLDRRGLFGDLFGSQSTSVENVNDNSQHTQTMNQHGNRHTTVTKIHKEARLNRGDGHHGDRADYEATSATEFFERRRDDVEQIDGGEPTVLDRRGLLWGGSSTSISNVNDNSRTTKTFNSHDNTDTNISKTEKYLSRKEMRGRVGNGKRRASRGNGQSEHWMEKRGLLLGGDSMTISNQNINSKETKTYNSHNNQYKKYTKTDIKEKRPSRSSWFDKRKEEKKEVTTEAVLMDKRALNVQAKQGRRGQDSKVLQAHSDAKSLVTIQIVNQNQSIDNRHHSSPVVNKVSPTRKRVKTAAAAGRNKKRVNKKQSQDRRPHGSSSRLRS